MPPEQKRDLRKDRQPGQSRSPRKMFSTDPRCNVYQHHHHHQPRHHGISSTGQPRCIGARHPNDPRHRRASTHRHTEALTAAETTEDPGGTVAATTEGEDTVAESTATEVMVAGCTATGNQTTPETGRTAQATENPEAGGTPGGRLETDRTEGGTTAAMAGAKITAIKMPDEAEIAEWSPEDG